MIGSEVAVGSVERGGSRLIYTTSRWVFREREREREGGWGRERERERR